MKYERLTDKNDLYWALQETKLSAEVGIYLTDCLNFLAELEDKIEQGTLIELPCKVGDTVYIACDWDINEVVEGVVCEVEYTVNANEWYYRIYVDHKYIFSKTNPNVVKSRYIFTQGEIFLTREEAEQRLKELQNG